MSDREVAVFLYANRKPDLFFGVRMRYRKFFVFWSGWLSVRSGDNVEYWDYPTARKIADQILNNGFVPHHGGLDYSGIVHPIFELDEEEQ